MECIAPLYITPVSNKPFYKEKHAFIQKVKVPCNKCIPCLQSKRLQWSFRIDQELKVSRSAHFVTLTYDRLNLKKANYQLCIPDLQKYLKRVRKRAKHIRIRYFAVGEYGSKTGRPHYHIILFNADEKQIRDSWTKGIVHVGAVNEASIKYCLKYIIQKVDKKDKKYQPPFVTMSRAYGIGAHYLTDEMIKWHQSGNKCYTMKYGVKGILPKFYYSKIWPNDEQLKQVKSKQKWENIKNHRNILREWRKIFPNDWKIKRAEHIQAVIDRVKIKITDTQKF